MAAGREASWRALVGQGPASRAQPLSPYPAAGWAAWAALARRAPGPRLAYDRSGLPFVALDEASEKELIGVHEASHAVGARACGAVPLIMLQVSRDDDGFSVFGGHCIEWHGPRALADDAFVVAMGPAGERKYALERGLPTPAYAARPDLVDMDEIVDRVGGGCAAAFRETVAARVENCLARPRVWAAILAVADEAAEWWPILSPGAAAGTYAGEMDFATIEAVCRDAGLGDVRGA